MTYDIIGLKDLLQKIKAARSDLFQGEDDKDDFVEMISSQMKDFLDDTDDDEDAENSGSGQQQVSTSSSDQVSMEVNPTIDLASDDLEASEPSASALKADSKGWATWTDKEAKIHNELEFPMFSFSIGPRPGTKPRWNFDEFPEGTADRFFGINTPEGALSSHLFLIQHLH